MYIYIYIYVYIYMYICKAIAELRRRIVELCASMPGTKHTYIANKSCICIHVYVYIMMITISNPVFPAEKRMIYICLGERRVTASNWRVVREHAR